MVECLIYGLSHLKCYIVNDFVKVFKESIKIFATYCKILTSPFLFET